MSDQKKEIVGKINASLAKPPKFISENNRIDRFFVAFYNDLKELEYGYDSVAVNEDYLITNMFNPVKSLVQLLNDELKNKPNKDNTLPLSLNDMKLIDQFVKFITLQVIYRYLPSSINPQSYLLVDTSKSIYGSFNKLQRVDNIQFLDYAVDKIIEMFYNKDNSEGSKILKDCLKLTNFHYDLIVSTLYLSLKSNNDVKYADHLDFLENTAVDTYDLYVNYSIWINYLNRTIDLQRLLSIRVSNLVIVKKDGLKSLIEFLLQLRETEEIDLAKLSQLNEVILKKPPLCKTNKSYFLNLFSQIFEILEMENNAKIILAIMNILSMLFNKNEKIINDFFNRRLITDCLRFNKNKVAGDTVSFHELIKKFNVLISMTEQSDSSFIQHLMEYYNEYDFVFLIYRYINFVYINYKSNKLNKELINESYINSLLNCLKFFLLCSNGKWYLLNYLIVNYDFNSQNDTFGRFIVKPDKTFELSFIPEIKQITDVNDVKSKIQDLQSFIKVQDLQNDLLIDVLKALVKNEGILINVFVKILRRWCESYNSENEADIFLQLNDLRVMNRLLELENFKDEISQHPESLLVVICDLLSLPSTLHYIKPQDAIDSDEDEDEAEDNNEVDAEVNNEDDAEDNNEASSGSNVLQMLLRLLFLILTSCEKFNKADKELLEKISAKLGSDHKTNKDSFALISKITSILSDKNTDTEKDDDELSEEKMALKQALSNLNDSLPPVKAQGLYELRELLLKKSKVVDYGLVLELHLLEVKNPEPFVYLNSIKGLVILCENDPSLKYLMKLYAEFDDPASTLAITFEEELRIGEVLSQFFQNKKYLINNDMNLHKMFSIVLKKINASNVNKLDNRIRMSAMSILGILIQVNMDLLTDSELIDCFACIKGILTFEFDANDETFKLLRRASIHLLNDMVYNSGLDRFVISFQEYENLINLLKYNRDHKENDDLTIEFITKLLSLIDDLWKQSFMMNEDSSDTLLNSLKIL